MTSKGFDAVCVFVNDTLNSKVISILNECEDCDFNNTEQVRKAYIESRIDSLLWKLNLYNDNRIWKYHQYEINKMINELKSYGVEIIERKDLKKYIK